MCGAMAVRFLANSEGWTAIYECDDADRLTKIIYPDGATSSFPGALVLVSVCLRLPEIPEQMARRAHRQPARSRFEPIVRRWGFSATAGKARQADCQVFD
jgi:hypothetical protein